MIRLKCSLVILAAGLALVGCSKVKSGPLAVQAPPDWKVEHKDLGGSDFYSVTGKNPNGGLLMFSKWPVPCSPDAMPAMVKELADGFVASVKKNPALKLASEEYRVESFGGEHCKGSYVTFESGTAANLSAIFMMHIDGQVWNGQFAGTKEDWAESLKVLITLKPKSW